MLIRQTQFHLGIVLALVQSVEVRITIQAADDGLAAITNCFWRFFSLDSTIQGKRFVQSAPPLVISRTRPPLRSRRSR